MPKLIVEVVGDTRHFERSLGRSSKEAQKFSATISRAGRSVAGSVAAITAASLGTALVVDQLRKSVGVASDFAEAVSKTEVVFEDSAASIKAWSRTSAQAMGLAQDQALETASSLGALLTPIGVTGREAAEQSKRLTQLGADLASFYNTSVQDALVAVRAGIIGEAEPLRRYGVLLSEARVKAEAMAASGKKTAESLTNQEKALARIKIIFQDTGKAQGDFARTSEGLANQQRILGANVRDLQARIGELLIPVVLDITRKTNKWLGETKNQDRVLRDIKEAARITADAFTLLADAVSISAEAFRDLRRARGSAKDLLGPFGFLLDGPTDVFRGQAERTEKLLEAFGLISPKVPGIQGPQGPAEAIRRGTKALQDPIPPGIRGAITKSAAEAAPEAEAAGAKIGERFSIGMLSGTAQLPGAIKARLSGIFNASEIMQQFQFRALGLDKYGNELAATTKQLRARLGTVTSAVTGTILDTNATQKLLARVRKLLSGQLGNLTEDVRRKVSDILAALQVDIDALPKKKKKKGKKQGGYAGIPGLRPPPGIPSQTPFIPAPVKIGEEIGDGFLSRIDKLDLFAGLKGFGGNLWHRGGAAPGGMSDSSGFPNRGLVPLPSLGRVGTGASLAVPTRQSGQTPPRHSFFGTPVTVVQNFQAPTTDRHREARYAAMAVKAAFDQ